MYNYLIIWKISDIMSPVLHSVSGLYPSAHPSLQTPVTWLQGDDKHFPQSFRHSKPHLPTSHSVS